MKQKIGVYICQCGSNISDYVDVDKVLDSVKDLEGVSLVKITMFSCSDSTQNEMVDDIKNEDLDGLVVASCSPKLHLPTFRNVAIRGGLNPYNYVQVNIREQGSWAHSDNPKKATEKAIQLVKAGIERTKYSNALEKTVIPSEKAVAVIGAGIAGMKAAIELADMGLSVYLIEKDFFVGGRITQWEDLCTVEELASDTVTRLYDEVKSKDNLTLFLGATAENMSGSVGNFKLTINIRPRYIKSDFNKDKIEELTGKCKTLTPNEFDFGLTKRKIVFKTYPGALPDIPVVDIKNAGDDINIINEFKDHLDLDRKDESITVDIGSVILATGSDPYTPKVGELGYKEIDNVVTFQEFKRIIELSPNGKLKYNGKDIKSVGYIYCVGSCQAEGNMYCSRFCCTCAISTSLSINKRFEKIRFYHVYKHIRTYGKQEVLYDQAGRQGDIFFKFDEDEEPVVSMVDGEGTITFNDLLTDGEEISVSPDLIVLVTGMVPRDDYKRVAEVFKAPIGRDKFFNEAHPKLRPVETVIDGIMIAGASQGPKSISESTKSALSAASKADALLHKGEIELEPTLAMIDTSLCEGSGLCIQACPFNAITMIDAGGKKLAQVEKSACKGCGWCLAVCPHDAIELAGYTNNEMEGMIESLITV